MKMQRRDFGMCSEACRGVQRCVQKQTRSGESVVVLKCDKCGNKVRRAAPIGKASK